MVDKLGVNMVNGQVTHSLNTVSIGGAMGLSHSVSVYANEFNYLGYRGFGDKYYARARNAELCTSPGSCSPMNVMRVHDWEDTVSFAYYVGGTLQQNGGVTSGYTYVAINDERHTLVASGNDLVWTKPNGTVVRFDRGTASPQPANKDGILTSVAYPNGFTITVTAAGGSVNTNTGFQLKHFYVPDERPMDKPNDPALINAGPLASSAASGWSSRNPKYVRGINAAVEYCAWTASNCTLTKSWPSATFDWPPGMPRTMFIGDSTVKVANAQGLTTTYTFRAYDLAYNEFGIVVPPYTAGREFSPRLQSIAPPGSGAVVLTYDYKNLFGPVVGFDYGRLQKAGVITRATRQSLSATYNMLQPYYSDSQNGASGPGNITLVHLQARSGDPSAVYYADTGEGRVWYEETASGFIRQFDRIAAPRESYAYTRRNLTSITYSGGSSQVAVIAEYPASCTPSTQKTCNQATRLRDKNGQWTDYTYHAPSGQVESVTYPANKQGIRPQTRYEYTQLSAHYYDANGSWINGSPIWMKTAEKSCINSSSTGNGCAGGDEVITRYEYNHNNLLMTGMTMTDPGGTTLRTCFQYDIYGNQIGDTQPKANLVSCP